MVRVTVVTGVVNVLVVVRVDVCGGMSVVDVPTVVTGTVSVAVVVASVDTVVSKPVERPVDVMVSASDGKMNVVPVLVPASVEPRYTSYPVTPTLSVDALQVNRI